MIRFIFRLAGYMCIGGGFVALVLDGARSIANQSPGFVSFGEMVFRVVGNSYLQLQPAIERHLHPMLWDPVILNLTLLPGFAVALAVGFFLLWAVKKPDPGVGIVTRA